MAERLTSDLWRLDIPLVGNPLKNLNSYLLLGERSLLIDTGFRQQPCREAMERQLAEIGVDRDRLDIFCTHLHSDHTGLAPELIRPGCRIFIGEIDEPGVRDAADPAFWQGLYREYVLNGFTWEEMETLWGDNPAQTAAPPWREGLYTPLPDGGELRYGGHTLRCVLTPGHTPGHLCLYDPECRRLFCGAHVLFQTPGLTAYEIAGRMAWSIRCRNWTEFPLTQKFFAVGEALAHLDYLEARGQIHCRETAGKRVYFAGAGDKI